MKYNYVLHITDDNLYLKKKELRLLLYLSLN